MRSRFMRTLVCLAACGILVIWSGCGEGSGKTVIKASLILGETSDWYRGMARWAELVDRNSHGAIEIRLFPQASLSSGKQDTELEMVQSGTIEASFESSILLSGIEPAFSVWSLPWLFENYAAADSALLGEPGREMLALLESRGLVGLGYGHNGFRQLTNGRRPVRTPEDVAGLKIRVPAISMYLDVFRALGADPSPMNFGEVFLALQQGTIDGQENPLSVIHSARLYEVQDYLTIWNYSYDPIILCVNKDFFESLPADQQTMLRQTADEALAYQRRLVEEGEARLLSVLGEQGMEIVTLTPGETERFRSAVAAIDESYADRIGRDRLGMFREPAR